MKTVIITFNKELLYGRFCNDIMSRVEPRVDIVESDRVWFDIALTGAANIVMEELSRIAKKVEYPISESDDQICFEVLPVNTRQKSLLPLAVEKTLLAQVENEYYTQRMGIAVVDARGALLDLKYVTLISSGVLRKPAY